MDTLGDFWCRLKQNRSSTVPSQREMFKRGRGTLHILSKCRPNGVSLQAVIRADDFVCNTDRIVRPLQFGVECCGFIRVIISQTQLINYILQTQSNESNTVRPKALCIPKQINGRCIALCVKAYSVKQATNTGCVADYMYSQNKRKKRSKFSFFSLFSV